MQNHIIIYLTNKIFRVKNKINNILNIFGIKIQKLDPELKNRLSFDDIYKNIFKIYNKPIIFDIGANQGQSIDRFIRLFNNPIIHAFEPIKFEYENLINKYKNNKNIILNNFAIGDKDETNVIYVAKKTGNSSFYKINHNSKWLRKRSKQFNTSPENYAKIKQRIKVTTIDKYCKMNNIQNIDLLKIDTQGYEDKVLSGSKKILKKNIISIIETEIIFDNTYQKYLTFSDLEKFLLPNNYRFCGLNTNNNNLFEGLVFSADLMYVNKRKLILNKNNL